VSMAACVALAILQGLAEFLPVSSSGHLVLAQHFLGVEQPGIELEVVLHLGTLVSVLAVFWKEVSGLAAGVLLGRRQPVRTLLLILLASVPAALVGFLLGDKVEEVFDSPMLVAVLLCANGIILLLAGRTRQGAGREIGPVRAAVAGLAQALAVLPGISRAGSTISALLACGVSPAGAARFSFLMFIPAVAGAGLHEAMEGAGSFTGGLPVLLLGFAVSACVGILSLKLLLDVLGRGRLWVFGIYCMAAGTVSAVLLNAGV